MDKEHFNNIVSWRQGKFIDGPNYKKWSEADKANANSYEVCNVRPSPKGNSICRATTPDLAKWIAQRLNLAAELEKKINQIKRS